MPSPPSIHQRQNNNKSTPSNANTNNNANVNVPPTSSPAFATFPTNNHQLPSLQQFPSNSIQTNLLLNSLLLRHLQLSGQQNATGHHQSSSTQSMLPPMFWPNNDFFSPSSQLQPPQPQQSQPTLTGPLAGSTAMFTKNVDSLYNFLSPNVILLPVACHSIPDEQHIQLLGMPQTIIPVSLHPNMLHQFPIRPLLVEPGLLTNKMSAGNQVPILMANSMPKDNNQQFHLPISFRQSFFSSSPPSNQPTITPISTTGGNSRSTMAGMTMEHCSERERTPPSHPNHSKSIGKIDELLAEDAANPIEPLDLSMATTAFSDPSSSTLATTTNSNTNNKQQSRKRATEKKENEQQQQMQRKRIKSDEVQENNLSSLHPIMASTASNGVGMIQGLRNAGPLASIPLKMVTSAVSGTDEKPKKRFPCDLCGDVSFLALETLEGHQKYYCRNRPRPNPPMETPKPIANGESFSSNNPIVPPSPLLQWQHSEQLAKNNHERQVHPHSFVCAVCGYKTSTIRGLRTHMRISHEGQKQNQTKMNGQKIKEKDGEEEIGENDEKNENEERKSALVEIKLEK